MLTRRHVVFYTSSGGHEYGLYNAVQQQAQYFGLDRLEDWILNNGYLRAVRSTVSSRMLEDPDDLGQGYGSNAQLMHYPLWKKEEVYLCPRGIPVHRGQPGKCGKDCQKARREEEDRHEDEDFVGRVWEVKTMTVFHHEVCKDLSL